MPRLVPQGPKIFFPNIVFRLIRSPPGYAPNEAVFRVPPRLNKLDIRTYLERLYGVTVTNVRTANYNEKVKWSELLRRASNGKPIVRPEKRGMGLRPIRVAAYKRAIVTMTEDFMWPAPPDADKAYSATMMLDFRKEKKLEKEKAKQEKRAADKEEQIRKEAETKEEEMARLLAELALTEPPKARVRGSNKPFATKAEASESTL